MRGLSMLGDLSTVTQAILARAGAHARICLALSHSAVCLLQPSSYSNICPRVLRNLGISSSFSDSQLGLNFILAVIF